VELQEFALVQLFARVGFAAPQPSILDKLGQTAEVMQDALGLTDFTVHPTAVEVESAGGRDKFRIGIAQAFASLTTFDDPQNGERQARNFLQTATEHLEEPKIGEATIRLVEVAPTSSFEELRAAMIDRIMVGSGALRSALGVGISDVGWAFDLSEDRTAGRVQFGPMKVAQLESVMGLESSEDLPPEHLFKLVELTFDRPSEDQSSDVDWLAKRIERARGVSCRVGDWIMESLK
jgi:hypothetical protein